MAEIKWIKLSTDLFDNRKIKHLRKLPEGNNVVLIWVMLLTLAGRCNANGLIFLTETIPYTPQMLANELDFDVSTVNLALQVLEQLGMIGTESGHYVITGWSKHQNIDGMEKVREQNRIRKQRQREREKSVIEDKCHVTSRDSHAIEEEEEIDIDKDIECSSNYIYIRHGKYRNINLTEQEFTSIKAAFPETYQQSIESMSAYMHDHKKDYPNHYNRLVQWAKQDKERIGKRTGTQGTRFSNFTDHDYDYDALFCAQKKG